MKKVVLFLFIFGVYQIQAQNTNLDAIEIIPSDGEVIISPAELQNLLRELMEFKQKRLQNRRLNQGYALGSGDVSQALNDQSLKQKIETIDKTLTQINERLTFLKDWESVNKLQQDLRANDLDKLKTDLNEELKELKVAIQVIATNPPTPTLSPAAITNDSTYRSAVSAFYLKYAEQMIEMRAAFDSLQTQVGQLTQKSNLDSLQQSLYRLETKTQTPIIVKIGEDSTGITQNIEPTAYWEKQFAEIKFLINGAKTNPNNATPNNDNAALLAEVSAMRQILQELKDDLANTTTVDKNPPKEDVAAELAAIRKMIADLDNSPSETVLKETITTEPFPPDTTYNRLRRIIADKEQRILLFDNNSAQLKQSHLSTIEEMAFLMKNYGAIDVMVTGFTSDTGTPIYNQTLSQNRAEAVKRQLMTKGIHSSRIFTDYHGIDYDKKDAAQGRRVEMMLMIKR